MKYTLSRQEVADIFSVNPQTVSNWIAYGLLKSTRINEKNMINRASVDKLIEKFKNIGEVEKRIAAYKEQCLSLEKGFEEKVRALKQEHEIFKYGKIPMLLSMFDRAYRILSNPETERTVDVVTSYLKGESLLDIGKRHNITAERTKQILWRGIRRLGRAEKYATLLEENKKYRIEIKILKGNISALEKNISALEKIMIENIAISKAIADGKNIDEPIVLPAHIFCQKLVDMDVSTRALNCLLCFDPKIEMLGELARLNRQDLLKCRNFGRKTLNELEELLDKNGLHWGMNIVISNEEAGQ